MDTVKIYTASNGEKDIEVSFDRDSAWLSLNQLVALFGRDKSVISRHISNVFKDEELVRDAVVAKIATTAKDGKVYTVEYFNLDVIISVGYRVKSRQGVDFRIWATKKLREILLDGVAYSEKRLNELGKLFKLLEASDIYQDSEAKGILSLLSNYAKSFTLLNQFDSSDLSLKGLENNITYQIQYEEACEAVEILKKSLIEKKEATQLFGNQKDNSFEGTLNTVVQTFDGYYLYPSIEEQAANLLYLIIKNHPFSDGNKRIGAFMFVWFLQKNKYSLKLNTEVKINDNALTALALLIAQSNADDKDLMIKLVCNFISRS